MCIPDFDAIRDKRMSELTPEQKEDSRELWLRENVAWMGEYHAPLYTLLISRLDAARAAYSEKLKDNQKLACDLLTDETQAAGKYGDVSVTTLEKMRATMVDMGISTDESLELFGARLEDNLLATLRGVNYLLRAFRFTSSDVSQLVRQLDVIWNGEEGAAKQASLCDLVSQISKELPGLRTEPKLDKPAMVGRGRFHVGVSWSTVIGAAQRLYEYEVTPEKEAARIKRAKEALDHMVAANEFNRAINFAISLGMEADQFLRCWREGDWEGCKEFGYEVEELEAQSLGKEFPGTACSECDGSGKVVDTEDCEWPCPRCQSVYTFPLRNPDLPAEQQGLFQKFSVRRTDGSDLPGGKHYNCRYFVIDMDHDQHAPAALIAYGAACKETHPQLSKELLEFVERKE